MRRSLRRSAKHMISPDEILLDAHNLPAFDPNRLEGRLNRPISMGSLRLLTVLVALSGIALAIRTGQLMVVEGADYAALSEKNRLGHSIVISERGIIYDRFGVPLAWNTPHLNDDGTPGDYNERAYASTTGSGHVLGYVRLPARDSSGIFYREGIEGVSGAELVYDSTLRGLNGVKIIETDARMHVQSEGIIEEPIAGDSVTLTVDARLQEALYGFIASLAESIPFDGGAGVIMDVRTGEIIAMTGYPEYKPEIMLSGDTAHIAAYNSDERTPYLNRTVAGQYTPGSIVKPFLAAAALTEGIVRPETTFVSTGELRLANPYNPGQYSVFTDWKAHGAVNLRRALAVSSDIYFYHVGGGWGGQPGLGISRIESYMRMFGFGMPTGITIEGERHGIIPSPEWKAKTFPDDPEWRIGDTYITSIGQYGFQVTPIQVVRAVAALANGGLLLTPRIETEHTQYGAREINIPDEHLRLVRAGMRDAVLGGTAAGLNVPYIEVAGKTGTAEVGVTKDFVHSWVMGFFPYEKPRYAFALMMEHGPSKNLMGATSVMRNMLDWMHTHTPEYVLNDAEFATSVNE